MGNEQSAPIDSFPVLSQIKSYVQSVNGDLEGALRTQENFSRTCPVVSQVRSTVESICGNNEAALDTQREFLGLNQNGSQNLDSIPIASQIKSIIQSSIGDMDGALRTQENFSRGCPGISQLRSAVEVLSGDCETAHNTQRYFLGISKPNDPRGDSSPEKSVSPDEKSRNDSIEAIVNEESIQETDAVLHVDVNHSTIPKVVENLEVFQRMEVVKSNEKETFLSQNQQSLSSRSCYDSETDYADSDVPDEEKNFRHSDSLEYYRCLRTKELEFSRENSDDANCSRLNFCDIDKSNNIVGSFKLRKSDNGVSNNEFESVDEASSSNKNSRDTANITHRELCNGSPNNSIKDKEEEYVFL